jgi:chromosome segregation ATPase
MVNNKNIQSNTEKSQNDVDLSEISMLIERVDQLENTVNHITEQQGTLTHHIREHSESLEKHSDSIENVNDTVSELKNMFEELQSDTEIRESRVNSITRSLDALEENLQDTRSDIDDTSDKLGRRLTAIENMLELDEMDIAQAVKPNACELEQLTTIPKVAREESFDVRVQRAIAVYEKFNEISTPVKSGGRRILSRDIKTFLNGYSNSDIAYSQVQRVIDSFDEKTEDDYMSVQTGDGRAIVWKPKDNES